MTEAKGKAYFGFVDSAKGIAILLVILVHLPIGGTRIFTLPIFADFANVTFFILSAYLLCFSWERLVKSGNRLVKFYSKRVLRIVPFYYCILLIIFFGLRLLILLHLVLPSSYSRDAITFQYLLLHMAFLWEVIPPFSQTFNIGEWFVSTLFYLTLLFPFLFFVCKTKAGIFCMLVASMIFSAFIAMQYPGWATSWLMKFTIPRYLPAFVLGIFLYKINNVPIKQIYLAFLLICLVVLHKFFFTIQINMLLSAVFILSLQHKIYVVKYLNNSLTRLLGKTSYSLYLINIPIIISAKYIAHSFFISHSRYLSWILLLFLFLLITPVVYRLEKLLQLQKF